MKPKHYRHDHIWTHCGEELGLVAFVFLAVVASVAELVEWCFKYRP